MSIRNGILAILSMGPCHGYQIKHELEVRTGSILDVNIGQIYSTLGRLETDGLVVLDETSYRITELGSTTLAEWLATPVASELDLRNDLASKLALAVTIPGTDVSQITKAQKNAALQTLQELTRKKRLTPPDTKRDLAAMLMLERQIFAVEAELRWLEFIDVELKNAVARGLEEMPAIDEYVAKRGRPAKSQIANQGGNS